MSLFRTKLKLFFLKVIKVNNVLHNHLLCFICLIICIYFCCITLSNSYDAINVFTELLTETVQWFLISVKGRGRVVCYLNIKKVFINKTIQKLLIGKMCWECLEQLNFTCCRGSTKWTGNHNITAVITRLINLIKY